MGRLLSFGTSVGSIYVYHRSPLTFLKILSLSTATSDAAAITCLRISPHAEDVLAVGFSNGQVVVVEGHVRSLKEKEKVVLRVSSSSSGAGGGGSGSAGGGTGEGAFHRASITTLLWHESVRHTLLFSSLSSLLSPSSMHVMLSVWV